MNKDSKTKKKLLTIDDLVRFCQANKLQSFNSKETGYELCVQVPATFKKSEENEDDSLLILNMRCCHIGINRNNSMITEEAMRQALPTLKYKPILCGFKDVEDENGNSVLDFTSHDMEITEDGKINYIERQVGCFTADEPYLQYVEDMDKTYVFAKAVIPREYTEAASILERKGYTKVSVELIIDEMSFNSKEKCLALDKFIFSGCTLLGEDVGEGMLGSRADIADFSKQNNSVLNYSDTDNKLVKILEKINSTLATISEFNIKQNNKTDNNVNEQNMGKEDFQVEDIKINEEVVEDNAVETEIVEDVVEDTTVEATEEVTEPTTENMEEIVEEESEDVEDETVEEETTDEETNTDEETVDEETEVKEEEACGGSGGSKKKKVKHSIETEDGKKYEFELSYDDISNALWQLVNDTYSDSDNCYYGVKTYEKYVIMQDWCTGRTYRQDYTNEDDTISLVGVRVEVYVNYLTKEEEEALTDMKSNYSVIEEKLVRYEKAELDAQKQEIISDVAYAEFVETEEFNSIKEKMDDLSPEKLRTECDLAFAKLVKAKGTFAVEEKVEVKKINKKAFNLNATEKDNEPYGDYFKSLQ